MSQPTVNMDRAEIAQAEAQKEYGHGAEPVPPPGDVKREAAGMDRVHSPSYHSEDDDYADQPTEEELHSLRRVSGHINWAAYSIAFCELAERFSYYGSTVLYSNFINWPLPEGSNTGAGHEGQSGALGMGQKAAQGLILFNSFFAYLMPLFGAYVADAHLGRYKTIHIAIAASFVGHLVLVAAAAPSVIIHQKSSLAALIVGIITLGFGTGFFKSNIAPLLAEQNPESRIHVKTLKSGERVIVDPAVTNTRIFLMFYLMINIGSVAGQISMVYTEKYHSFWLAFTLPTVLFAFAPILLALNKKRYTLYPPTGSVLSKFLHMFSYAMKGHWFSPRTFSWDVARPSYVPVEQRPHWMTYDDAWVDEVRRGLKACKVFLFLPIFFLAYNQMTGNLVSQAATMELHGVPNDIIQNLNPLSIIILIPILDRFVYPGLRKLGVQFTPLKRMALGFGFSALSMVAAAVTQYYIYTMSPCGYQTTTEGCTAPINVWAQSLPYILVGISEIFTNTTSLEYAYSKAPANMRSMVMSVNLFMSAISSAIGQAFVPLSEDPLLVWNYGVVAVIAAVGGVLFWVCFRKLDAEEDMWNSIKKSHYRGGERPTPVVEDGQVVNHTHQDEKSTA